MDKTPKERAHNFYSAAPRYRTKARLAKVIREAEAAAFQRGVRAAQKPYSHFDYGMECG